MTATYNSRITVKSGYCIGGTTGRIVPVQVAIDPASRFTYASDRPDAARAKNRILPALRSVGLDLQCHPCRLTVAASGLDTTPPTLDLATAVAILTAFGITPLRARRLVFMGELALDGRVLPTQSPISLEHQLGDADTIIVPYACLNQAGLLKTQHPHRTILGADTLGNVVDALNSQIGLPKPSMKYRHARVNPGIDLADYKGQCAIRRALEIAAAGGHGAYIVGPAGEGKSMAMKALPGLLPPLETSDTVELTCLYHQAGLLAPDECVVDRPYRELGPTSSRQALLGGGSDHEIVPGEVTLAHRGVLAIDELPELPRSAIEAIRRPMQDGTVVISRRGHSVQFPCQFMLVATGNECPCGHWPHCTCTTPEIRRYQRRISGAVLDRIDIKVRADKLPLETQLDESIRESSEDVRDRVVLAKQLMVDRCRSLGLQPMPNAQLPPAMITHLAMTRCAREELEQLGGRYSQLTTRSVVKIRLVAQTIADLSGMPSINRRHIAEAAQWVLGGQAAIQHH